MKIQLLSDLHLEAHPHWQAEPAPQAELLVLAGDIGSYQAGSLLSDADFGLGRFAPTNGWPTPVIFVPGNHEYDMMDFDEAHARLRATCARLGIIWLEREVICLPDSPSGSMTCNKQIRFIGTTLWSDFDALAPLQKIQGHGLSDLLKAREKAFRAANYYLRKTGTTLGDTPMLAEQIRELALECQQWLNNILNTPFAGQTVVVTHFAPSLRSADPRYGLTPGTAGFCNQLEHLLPLVQLWLHGHLHSPSDYVQNGCRVVANPLGYLRKNEQTCFIPNLVIDTDRPTFTQ